MSIPVTLRPAREELVRVQYAEPELVAGYANDHAGWGPTARYHHSRRYAIDQVLAGCPGGDLLDVGCGPGMMVRHLLDTRPGDFRITACDQSPAMIEAVAARAGANVKVSVGDIQEMPFGDRQFDVVLAMGVLEYTDAVLALHEIARVTRPGGLVVTTMLNPRSPYRLFEWGVFWPARRTLGALERLVGVPPSRRHGARRTGIVALTPRRLRELLWRAGLQPEEVIAYDVTASVPPFDRLARRRDRSWRAHPETTIARGAKRWLGTGYLVSARKLHG
ncbi:class I SAM-dependent methyltransferase [Amycolatopsis vancoresmycina]|uniref:class I SAM-dependent methyltransferase n=1 Tax=Amycolatopsis vancoresmycina TaxID=208444 RepID=UPI0003A25BC5|nr:class I SAM-dependent methyltransferase [Amycolatopsis vancoresmycina]